MDSTEDSKPRLLREKSVLKKYPVSHATWWAGIKEGRYPRPIRLSPRTVAWLEADIDALVERAVAGEMAS